MSMTSFFSLRIPLLYADLYSIAVVERPVD